jgi:hypothetical protein
MDVMPPKLLVPGLYELAVGQVNCHLLDAGDEGLVLVDTGYPGSAAAILEAVESLGRRPDDLRHIIVTHLHEDHAGSLAELKRQTGAASYMHAIDAEMTRAGKCLRPLVRGPGLLNGLVFRLINRKAHVGDRTGDDRSGTDRWADAALGRRATRDSHAGTFRRAHGAFVAAARRRAAGGGLLCDRIRTGDEPGL